MKRVDAGKTVQIGTWSDQLAACLRNSFPAIVTIFCDNKAFQQSGAKGRSKAARLNDLVKELFLLMVKYNFVVDLQWISTDENVNADDLSRDKEQDFLDRMAEDGVTVAAREVGSGK